MNAKIQSHPDFSVLFASTQNMIFTAKNHTFVLECTGGSNQWAIVWYIHLHGQAYECRYTWAGSGNPVDIYLHAYNEALTMIRSGENFKDVRQEAWYELSVRAAA